MLTKHFNSEALFKDGFIVFPLRDRRKFEILLCEVRAIFHKAGVNDTEGWNSHRQFFEGIHCVSPFDSIDINEIRVKIISALASEDHKVNAKIFELVEPEVTSILGPDILTQRGVNLVVQRPHDPDPSEPHRDFPSNSAFEIVIWLPLCDCPIDRSMFVVNFEESLVISQLLRSGYYKSLEMFNSDVLSKSRRIPVAFGEVMIFLTPIFHGSMVNSSSATRVSFNTRVKSFFSPSGLKDPFLFWEQLRASPVTKRGLQALKSEL